MSGADVIQESELDHLLDSARLFYSVFTKQAEKLAAERFAGEKYKDEGEMRSVTGGVVEVYKESGRIDGALDTEEGPLSFEEGKSVGQSSDDIQSGALPGWRASLECASDAIRSAYDSLKPSDALREIAGIWEELDRCTELAAARSRLLLGRLDPPNLEDTPDWFVSEREKLVQSANDEGDVPPPPWALDTAGLLVRAALASLEDPADASALLEEGPLGRVVVEWAMPQGRLQWMVEGSELSWPAIKVYQVRREGAVSLDTPADTRVLYNAFDAVKEFHEAMG